MTDRQIAPKPRRVCIDVFKIDEPGDPKGDNFTIIFVVIVGLYCGIS